MTVEIIHFIENATSSSLNSSLNSATG